MPPKVLSTLATLLLLLAANAMGLRSILESPRYIGVLALASIGIFLILRGSRRLPIPNAFAAFGCLAGLAIASVGLLFTLHWLTSFGAVASAFAILGMQLNKPGDDYLTSLAWFLVPASLCVAQQELNPEFTTLGAVSGHGHSVLNWFQIPHDLDMRTIRTTKGTEELPDIDSLLFSWPLAAFCGVLYSVILKRDWAVTGCNLFSGIVWWYLCLLGWLTTLASLRHSGNETASGVILGALGFAAVLLFLSTERGIRGILAPVTDATGDRREANPLIFWWNRMSVDNSGRNEQPQVSAKSPILLSVAAIAVLAIEACVFIGLI